MAYVADPYESSPYNLVVACDKEKWTMGGLLEVEEEARVENKRHLRDLHKSCRARRRKVQKGFRMRSVQPLIW